MDKYSERDKAVIVGLFLSKFGKDATMALGFKTDKEAFNVLGYSLRIKPASLKNYRDEFDPLFPNSRKGWHKRDVREYCNDYYIKFNYLSFLDFLILVKSILITNYELEAFINNALGGHQNENVAKRLATGRSAEEFFIETYNSIDVFSDCNLIDTRLMACGFDFKLNKERSFTCVEVKGINANSGSILMTEKEFAMADVLKDKFCLFVVKNFIDKPYYEMVFDPLESRLNFKLSTATIIQKSYSAQL